jgi:hypothetical protein
MTMHCRSQLAVSILLVHAPLRSKFARAMHPVADFEGRSGPDAGKTSQYATAQNQFYEFGDVGHPSSSDLNSSILLPELNQST